MRTTGLKHSGSNSSGGPKAMPVGRGGGTRATSMVHHNPTTGRTDHFVHIGGGIMKNTRFMSTAQLKAALGYRPSKGGGGGGKRGNPNHDSQGRFSS